MAEAFRPGTFLDRLIGEFQLLDAWIISRFRRLISVADFRRATGGIKLHLLLAHTDYLPVWVLLTPALLREPTLVMTLRLARESIVS